MIIRIVKMTFQPDRVDDFLGIFNKVKENIAAFNGCRDLQLWEDTISDNVFFTYSEWIDMDALNTYRTSELFKNTWNQTKALFSDKPEAWSLQLAS